jgi:hypothetical protein
MVLIKFERRIKMEDVAIREVEVAAKKSTLAAVRCSMRHHLYNVQVTVLAQASTGPARCALCARFNSGDGKCTIKGKTCPLHGDNEKHRACCREYYEASNAKNNRNLEGFRTGAVKLIARLAKIEYDLMHKDEKKEEKEEETYTGGQLFRVGKSKYLDVLVSVDYNKIALVSPEDGNHWGAFLEVKDTKIITEKDLNNLCGTGNWEALPRTAKLVVQYEEKIEEDLDYFGVKLTEGDWYAQTEDRDSSNRIAIHLERHRWFYPTLEQAEEIWNKFGRLIATVKRRQNA